MLGIHRPTFGVLSGSGPFDAEGLPGPAAVTEAPALGHFRGAVLDAVLICTWGATEGLLALRRALAFVPGAPWAGEHPLLQTHLLTVSGRKHKEQGLSTKPQADKPQSLTYMSV